MAYRGVRLTAQLCWLVAFFAFVGLWPAAAWAQSDEIQVYTGELAPVGIFNLTWHNNYTPSGIKTPAFPGAIISDRSLNGTTEWALGVTDWFEAGLYLPLYSIDKNRGGTLDGWKLRTLFAVPDAAKRTFVYGVNFEFSFNSKHWDSTHFTSEIRPIVGWHLGQWDLFINPILDTSYDGVKNLDFAPSLRLAYNFSDNWAVAAEHYADFGPVRKFLPGSEQSHQLFAVMDYSGEPFDVEAGVGFGLTNASDHLTLKLILSRDLN
ncbi:MAG: hypothetical protein QOF03_60 [Alphaproteobacteria bacterium]|nr:hypothetical protein [Alphaproteobacteria bacterium]